MPFGGVFFWMTLIFITYPILYTIIFLFEFCNDQICFFTSYALYNTIKYCSTHL